MSYTGHSLGVSYPSAEKKSVYSSGLADWANFKKETEFLTITTQNNAIRTNYIPAKIGHHHDVTLSARISLTLSRHPSLSPIASGWFSGLHPVSARTYVRVGCPAFASPCEGVHRGTSLMSSSLLLKQCPACLVRLIWIVFVMGYKWPYICCFVRCCLQDLFNIARSILV